MQVAGLDIAMITEALLGKNLTTSYVALKQRHKTDAMATNGTLPGLRCASGRFAKKWVSEFS